VLDQCVQLEPIYVYAIFDKGSYYEMEPHALVRNTRTGKIKDVTPTNELTFKGASKSTAKLTGNIQRYIAPLVSRRQDYREKCRYHEEELS
jgi:hypothetical protein